ncbi:hypothetical protein M409DRAFT_21986 [Zasmidium cellare ATCC 36951]|uniref:Uncharacterized protein n=1 Tax=Zasmidium cellare ATCC 36951 TaxID=1080233 RepID=A0A6A6CP00_ZASCE|nr:uncharacterized protein M409DRAFT_21986 [Zasmidium cellare ATCC 36951]KAF2167840.1 hypothetical protein M409DRAFT_21986 [Zasmidium cellare ATCC 36951]
MDGDTTLWGLLVSSFLLILAYKGYDLLWGVPRRDGSLKAIVEVKRNKRFPNGNALTAKYTGSETLDQWMITPVILYEGLLDGSNLPYFLMLLDVHASMQATSTVMLVRLAAVHALPTSLTALTIAGLGMLNQAYGAAFVYPLYCMAEIMLDAIAPTKLAFRFPITVRQTQAIWIASMIGFAFPLIFAYPWLLSLQRPLRQKIVAYYRFAPLAFAAAYFVADRVGDSLAFMHTVSAHQTLVTVLDIATVYATIGHFAALVLPLFQPKPWHALRRVFLPTSSHIRPGSQRMISDAAHRFLQYDIYVIGAAFFVWQFWVEKGWKSNDQLWLEQ